MEPTGIEPVTRQTEAESHQPVTETGLETLAYSLTREAQNCPASTPSTSALADPLDADLARLIALWPALEEAGRKLLVTTAETLAGRERGSQAASSHATPERTGRHA
jgi:hypothetical protein